MASRREYWWMAQAIISLPHRFSPMTRTAALWRRTLDMAIACAWLAADDGDHVSNLDAV